jgi:uncharacterized repeat protein (TIGR01451 family)
MNRFAPLLLMTLVSTVSLAVLPERAMAQANAQTRVCWINAKTGAPVPKEKLVPNGTHQDPTDPDRASESSVPNEQPTGPLSTGPVATATNNYIRVPCSPQTAATTPSTKVAIAEPTTAAPGAPELTITKSHTGDFTQGGTGAYMVVVSNVGNAPTSGTVTVTEMPPSGLGFVSMSGTGWTCGKNTCKRSDALAAGASYPALTVTVAVDLYSVSQTASEGGVEAASPPAAISGVSTVIITKPPTDGSTAMGSAPSFEIRGFGGAAMVNGNSPSTAGFDGAVLFPLGNRVLVGPMAGFQWVSTSIVSTIGGGPPPSTFINTSVGFKSGNFGGRIAFPFGGWEIGVHGGATVAGSTITQQGGVCLPSTTGPGPYVRCKPQPRMTRS